MFDVHQGEFLVLLLVMQAEFQKVRRGFERRVVRRFDKRLHRPIDIGAVGHDLVVRRPGQQAAVRARMARPDRFVIGIEQIIEGRVEFFVIRGAGLENERLEKPCDVGEVPFGRADIRHRLNLLVLDRQAAGDLFGLAADRCKTLGKLVAAKRGLAARCAPWRV